MLRFGKPFLLCGLLSSTCGPTSPTVESNDITGAATGTSAEGASIDSSTIASTADGLPDATAAPESSSSGSSTDLERWSLLGDIAELRLGDTIVTGDFNGDGEADVSVSTFPGSVEGVGIYIAYGPLEAGVSVASDLRMGVFGAFGSPWAHISAVGDWNEDGSDDIAIGSNVVSLAGLVGTVDLEADVIEGFVVHPETEAGEDTIWELSYAGDVNGDETSDLLASAPGFSGEEFGSGRVYVMFGPIAQDVWLGDLGTWSGFVIARQSEANWQTGFSVSTAGDVNGDGYADVLVGTSASTHYLVYGKPDVASVQLDDVFGGNGGVSIECGNSCVTSRVRGIGDIDGDGASDFAIASDRGRVWVIYAQKSFVSPIELEDTGVSADGFLVDLEITTIAAPKISVATAGDVNNDGFDDIVVGCASNDEDSANGLYLVYGGSSDSVISRSELESGERGSHIGSSAPDDGFGHAVGDTPRSDLSGSKVLIGAAPFDSQIVEYGGRLDVFFVP